MIQPPTISLTMYDALKGAPGPFCWLCDRSVCRAWSGYAAARGWAT